MKIYILKRSGKNWQGNLNLNLTLMESDEAVGYAGYYFIRKKDALKYLRKYDSKYGNPFEVWAATLSEDKRDNRKQYNPI